VARNVLPGESLHGSDHLIRRLGGDPIAIAAATGVPATVFDDPSIPIDVDAALRFVELAAEVCQCETIGMQLGAQVGMTFLGPVWVLMQDAQTPRELLQDLQRHLALITTAILMGLVPTSDGVEVSVEIVARAEQYDRQAVEFCLCQMVRYLRERLGVPWHSPYVRFRHRAPASMRMHHQYFGPNVFFDCETSGFLIETQTLDRPLPNSHRGHGLIAAALREQHPVERELFAQRVEGMMSALMPISFPTQERVSKEMMLSTRTLQRRLLESGTSFNAIRDKVRAQLAAKYLRQSALSVGQISDLLGYSQSAAFCRAFARWHGTTPFKYRKGQEAGSS
jgi:AraC-like DNA-binding protein